jgi:hypothetical protein
MNTGFSNLKTLKSQLAPTLKTDQKFDDVILAIGQGVAAQFENLCGRRFAYMVNDTETFPADHAEFLLSRTPVVAVTLAELKNSEADGWVVQTDPNFIRAVNLVNGIVDCGPGDPGPYYAQLRLTYIGGYWWEQLEPDAVAYPSALPDGATPLPADLLNAWLLQCRHLWKNLDKLGIDILKDGQVASLRFPEDFAPTVEKTLGNYIRYKLV